MEAKINFYPQVIFRVLALGGATVEKTCLFITFPRETTSNEDLTQEAAGKVTAVHEAGEDTEGTAVVASAADGAVNSASG